MTIITASLFLPYTVHFEVDKVDPASHARFSSSGAAANTTVSSPIPVKPSGTGSAQKAYVPGKGPGMSQVADAEPQSMLKAESPQTQQQPLSSSPKDSSVQEFFYKNTVRNSSATLNNMALSPMGETETSVMEQPGKNYIMRRNQSFTYLQPRSRAESPSSPSTNLFKIASYNNLAGMNKSKMGGKNGVNMTAAATRGVARDGPDCVPYGGFSSPDAGHDLWFQSTNFDECPWEIVDYPKGNGGLRNAIRFSEEKGVIKDKVTWVGTSAMATDALSETLKNKISAKLRKKNCEAVFSDDFTFQGHYRNYCKQILWPTLHYQVPDDPKSKAFEDNSWTYYKKLNELFADKIAEIYKPGDIVWVHDYHLLLLPQLLRQRLGKSAKIGFFLHAAFPSSEVFRCLAQRKDLLSGMIGANTIGFQTTEYCRHFLQTCNRILLADVINNEGLMYKGEFVSVYNKAIGIDENQLLVQLKDPRVEEWKDLIQERWHGKKLIVGRDKLDRLRGVKQKLLAFERLLKESPELVNEVVLIQICLKSNNADMDLEAEIMLIVERINSLSATDFTSISPPVVFLNQDIDFQQYLALLSCADAFVVSTMREGMNLTCHEFLIATREKKSPLILSEFTGSAAIFQKGALLINPWDVHQISDQMRAAVNMDAGEKNKRWQLLHTVLLEQDCYQWVKFSISEINDSYTKQLERRSNTVPLVETNFVTKYTELATSHSQRLFILDFDTIATSNKLSSSLITDRKLSILSDLTAVPGNLVFVMSYLKKSDLDLMYGRISRLGLICENGGHIKFPGEKWQSLVGRKDLIWMDEVVKVAETMIERLPGSYLEVEDCLVHFHTDKVEDVERAELTISDCVTHINETFEKEDIHATAIKDLVVIQPKDMALKVFPAIMKYCESSNKKLQMLAYISSSTPTTEILFEHCREILKKGDISNVFTVASGESCETSAMSHVNGINELLTILGTLF